MLRKFILPVLGLFLGTLASGCTPMGAAVGAGATLGVAAAQEGGIPAATTDAAIRIQINDFWFRHNVDMYRKLSLTIKEGRVLITGVLQDPDMRVDAVRLAWQANGVRQVINEITIENSGGITGYMTDTWITTQLKSKLLIDKRVQSINYSVDTVKGTVYLMGVAQDQKELDRVIDHARNMRYVKNVVSYVRLRGETPAGTLPPTGTETP